MSALLWNLYFEKPVFILGIKVERTMPNRLPLEGLKVLEFGQIAAGPFAASLLADLGADVVKVERPDAGDGMRDWPPLSGVGSGAFSENFASLNRNKRSIVADLKNADDVAYLRKLSSRTDVLIENFRSGVLGRLGFGYEELRKNNLGLVYCSISGYGQKGPYASKGAFDVTVQAVSGIMSVTGEEGRPPIKCGVPIGDFCAGLYAAYTILAALMRRQKTRRGAYIDCSMLGSLIGVAALQTSEYFGTGNAPRRLGSAHPRNAPYQAFKASDDYFVIAAGTDKLWRSVCDVVGKPDLADDHRFLTQELRARNQKALCDILEPLFSVRTAGEWLEEMDKCGVPCAPINSYPQILSDPHLAAMQLVLPLMLPNGVNTYTTAYPVALSDYEFKIVRPPPILGEHTAHVLGDWMES